MAGRQAKKEAARATEPAPKKGARPAREKAPRKGNGSDEEWLEAHRLSIAEAAWYRAEQRGFAPGGELEDWLAAEAEMAAGTRER